MNLKECLKKARERSGMTQEEASSKLKVSSQTIANWESGRAKPDVSLYNEIAEAYGIDTSELTDALTFEILSENKNTDKKDLKYKDILPYEIDYSKLKDLEFTELEQKAFVIIASYAEFGTSPIEKLTSLTDNILNLCSVLDKLRKYNLYYSKYNLRAVENYNGTTYYSDFKLSDEGEEIFNIIKHNKNKLFSIYKLSFVDLLSVFSVYNLVDESNVENIAEIVDTIGVDGLILETYNYSEENNQWIKYYLNTKMQLYVPNKDRDYYSSRSKDRNYEEYISTYIDTGLFEIETYEITDELYLIEKEAYKKKLDFYNQNKDTYEDIKEPKQFNNLFAKKVVLTEKGINFLEQVNRSYE